MKFQAMFDWNIILITFDVTLFLAIWKTSRKQFLMKIKKQKQTNPSPQASLYFKALNIVETSSKHVSHNYFLHILLMIQKVKKKVNNEFSY